MRSSFCLIFNVKKPTDYLFPEWLSTSAGDKRICKCNNITIIIWPVPSVKVVFIHSKKQIYIKWDICTSQWGHRDLYCKTMNCGIKRHQEEKCEGMGVICPDLCVGWRDGSGGICYNRSWWVGFFLWGWLMSRLPVK